MALAPGNEERLPWIESPRSAARPRQVKRRRRSSLLVLLALLTGAMIAVMAYLAGRGTAPRRVSARPPLTVPLPPSRPVPAPLPRPLPEVTTPSTRAVAPPATERRRVVSSRPKAARAKAPRKAVSRRRVARRPVRSKAPRVVVHRNAVPRVAPAYVVPQRQTQWPAQPFAGPRGRVIQLGTYVTMARADAAWWRLVRVYPYLGTLPRMVSWIGPSPGRPRYYRLRLAADSRREARALCNNLHRIGRGCAVLRTAK